MTDNIMSTTETTENQGLRLIVDNAMPRQFDDTVMTDCQHTATETRHTATDETLLPPYTGKKIQDSLKISERTFYRYLSEIKEAWFWIPEVNFREGKGYSLLTLDQMKRRNLLSSKDEYVSLIHGENTEAIAVYQHQKQSTDQPIEAEILDESSVGMIYVPEVNGMSRLDLARKKQAEVHNRLTQTLEEFKDWDEALNAQITANKEATKIEGEAEFDEKVIELLLKKKAEQDRLKKLEALIDSGAISADDLLKKYAGSQVGNSPAAVS
jgi:hypothetical protein